MKISSTQAPQYVQAMGTFRRVDQAYDGGDRDRALAPGVSRSGNGAADPVELSSRASDIKSTQEMLLTEFGRQIEKRFGEAGVDLVESVGLDFSPEATGRRIFEFAVGMRGVFEQQNQGLASNERLDLFEDTIRGAVDDGYASAIDILEGMALDDSVLETAATTKELVDGMFDDYFAEARGQDDGSGD